MAGEDIVISASVRRIIARHWIDNSFVSIMTHRGVVHISGTLRKINAIDANDEVGEDVLQSMEQEIRRIKGVKRIVFTVDGWVKDGGHFIKISTPKKERRISERLPDRFGREGEKKEGER